MWERPLACPCNEIDVASVDALQFRVLANSAALLLAVLWLVHLIKGSIRDCSSWNSWSPLSIYRGWRRRFEESRRKEWTARDAKILEIYDEIRKTRIRSFVKYLGQVGGLLMMFLLLVMGKEDLLRSITTGALVEGYVIVLGCTILYIFFDGWAPLWVYDYFTFFNTTMLHAHTFIAAEGMASAHILRTSQFFMCVVAFLVGKFKIVTMVCCINVVIAGANIISRGGRGGYADASYVLDGFLITMLVGYLASNYLWLEAEARVGMMEANLTKAASQDLLDVMCDATVQLDKNMMLQCTSTRLDALLLRRAPVPETRSFKDFIAGDDLVRFEDFLGRAPGVGKASTIHLGLTDSMNGTVASQLFHVSAEDPFTKELVHLIGVQEDEGFKRHQPPALQDGQITTQESLLREQARQEVDECSQSLTSWCSDIPASFVILSCGLQLNVVTESDQARTIFGFGSSQEPILQRFKEPEVIHEWLMNVYMRFCAVEQEPQIAPFREYVGTTSVEIPASGMSHTVDVWCSLRKVPSDCQQPVTAMTLHLLPPDRFKKKKKKKQKQSRRPFADNPINVPHRDYNSDSESALSNEL